MRPPLLAALVLAAAALAAPAQETAAERIAFPGGLGGAVVGDLLLPGQSRSWVFAAEQGQRLTVSLFPDGADTHFLVVEPGGRLLHDSRAPASGLHLETSVRRSGEHVLTVFYRGDGASDFEIGLFLE